MPGRILVGCQAGVYVILFEGDVRLTLYTAADRFLDRMFSDANFKSVVVDLSNTMSIDSTSLGLLAKLSILAKRRFDYVATLISSRADITRILLSMGFDDVFHIVEVPLERTAQLGELPELVISEDDMRERVARGSPDAHVHERIQSRYFSGPGGRPRSGGSAGHGAALRFAVSLASMKRLWLT